VGWGGWRIVIPMPEAINFVDGRRQKENILWPRQGLNLHTSSDLACVIKEINKYLIDVILINSFQSWFSAQLAVCLHDLAHHFKTGCNETATLCFG
jgi:hypothetical protein